MFLKTQWAVQVSLLGHESDASFSPWILLMVPACSILVIQPTRLCHLRFRYNFYSVENFIILEEFEDLKRIFKKGYETWMNYLMVVV